MTETEFIQQAKLEIPENSIDRVSTKVKELLKAKDLVIDAHSHIFDMNSVPAPYVQLRFYNFKKKKAQGLLSATIERIIEKKLTQLVDKIIENVENSRKGILKFYKESVAKNLGTVISVPLMMDLGIGWKKSIEQNTTHKITPIHKQIAEVKQLLREDEPILPFFAVDPRRITEQTADKNSNEERCLYENFLDAFTGKETFFGVKIYPALGYLPTDDRLIAIFKLCEELNIPVTTHCGGNYICTTEQDGSKFKKEIAEYIKFEGLDDFNFKKYLHRAAFFNHPMHWETVLETFPKLRLNLGHFGGKKDWKRAYKGKSTSRIDKILEFMNKKEDGKYKYENLYSDFSYNILKKKCNIALKNKVLEEEILEERVLFGTDYWVAEPGALGKLNKRILKFKKVHKYNWQKFSNTNVLRFLGLDDKNSMIV